MISQFKKYSVPSHLLLLIVVSEIVSGWSTLSVTNKDYTLHTLFIFNFMKYSQWPEKSGDFKIGVFDSKDAVVAIEKMARVKSSASQNIIVTNTRDESELGQCQIVFIPETNGAQAETIIAALKSKHTLVVTEQADLIKKGACISFKIVDAKLKFMINEDALKTNGLKISGTLTALAEK